MRLANQAAFKLGHKPSWTFRKGGAIARCAKCGLRIGVIEGCLPIETAVTGEALIRRCIKKKGQR